MVFRPGLGRVFRLAIEVCLSEVDKTRCSNDFHFYDEQLVVGLNQARNGEVANLSDASFAKSLIAG